MKHLFTPLLLLGLSLNSVALPKLDFYARDLVDSYNAGEVKSRSAEAPVVKLIVQFNDGYSFNDVNLPGVRLDCDLGSGCYVLNVEIPAISRLAELDAVSRIEHGAPIVPCLNKARSLSNVDAVQAGRDGLLQAFDGTGVLTGIYDLGFDPKHPMLNNADGESRLKVLYMSGIYEWVYSAEKLSPEDNPNNFYWRPLSEANKSDDKWNTHGTQCVGILAGAEIKQTATNGAKFGGESNVEYGNIPFYGVATNSDIFISTGSNTPADVLSCFKVVVDYAERRNLPVVLSLSQAAYAGPHDGSTLFNREIAKLGEKAIICIASGNVGDTKMAVEKELTSTDTSLKTSFSYYNGTVNKSGIQFWASNDEMLEVEFGVFDKTANTMLFNVVLSDGESVKISSGTTGFETAYSSGTIEIARGVDAANNRAYAHFKIANLNCKNAANYLPVIAIKGKAGQVINGIIESEYYNFVSNGIEGCVEGVANGAYNDLASGDNVISVGAYISNNSWVTLDDKIKRIYNPIGSILSYSSYGRTFDGRTIPTLCAPGMKISCPLSSYYTELNANSFKSDGGNVGAYFTENGREYYWQTSQGTSLAAPFVAGTVALWLQANPNLKYSDVLSIIEKTSVNNITGVSDPIQGGYGKLDALAGIKMAIELGNAGVDDISTDIDRKFIVSKTGSRNYNLYYTGNVAGYNVSVYSIGGAIVESVGVEGNEYNFDASALVPGVYMIEAVGNNFREVRKIVVD